MNSNQLLNRPIDGLDLSVRTLNSLKASKIRTIRELVNRNEDNLASVYHFNETAIAEIKKRLAELNLSLGHNPDDDDGNSGSPAPLK